MGYDCAAAAPAAALGAAQASIAGRALAARAHRHHDAAAAHDGAGDLIAEIVASLHQPPANNARRIAIARIAGAGLRVDLYPEADKLSRQFKYASARGIQFVAVIGDDERAREEVSIKDMRSGEQRSVKRDEAAEELRKNMQP